MWVHRMNVGVFVIGTCAFVLVALVVLMRFGRESQKAQPIAQHSLVKALSCSLLFGILLAISIHAAGLLFMPEFELNAQLFALIAISASLICLGVILILKKMSRYR